uniref:coiled-coil domain-containing protein 66 n=1 Tax=Centroberyx gerrardi TaxID=166262 RepID=UPI003AB105CA
MNLGDGLLFELDNGKPRLILLSHGAEKNPAKLSSRPRADSILSCRQPSCLQEVQSEEQPARRQAGRRREARSKAAGAAASSALTSSTAAKTRTNHTAESSARAAHKVRSDRPKHSTAIQSSRTNGKAGRLQNTVTRANGKAGLKDTLANGEAELKESVVCLTNEQLQQILNTVQTSDSSWRPLEDQKTQGNRRDSKPGSSVNEAGGEGGGGGGGGGGTSQDKDNKSPGCVFSWLEDRHADSRAAVDAKKAQWRRELDEQVTLKQQQSLAPGRLQEALSVERREEQRRLWLEELDRQREETSRRRRQEKLLHSQTEDHERWAMHFDSLQRRPPAPSALPPAPSALPPAPAVGPDRGEWEAVPSSSLSLVWEAMSSCGGESVGRASVDTTTGYPTRAIHLRTMTALLDPTQIEERERRRLKQLEHQRAIAAQVEERRQQRERDEASRREEEQEEERRVALEREVLQRQYQLDTLRERQKKEQLSRQTEQLLQSVQRAQQEALRSKQQQRITQLLRKGHDVSRMLQTLEPSVMRAGKENICVSEPGGGDPYEAFARTERSSRDKRRPEWNTQRPCRRFVPTSERYPVVLQRSRQESRLRRQAELLALQERNCLSRTDPPPPPPGKPTQQTENLTEPRVQFESIWSPAASTAVESVTRGQSVSTAISTERGRSPPLPAVTHTLQSRQHLPSCSLPPLPPLPPTILEFVPYVRSDEVFNLDPLEPVTTPPPHTHTEAPQRKSPPPPPPPSSSQRDLLLHPELLRNTHTHTHRQQEILRGLAQLRQLLLQKQRELETGMNPLLKRH